MGSLWMWNFHGSAGPEARTSAVELVGWDGKVGAKSVIVGLFLASHCEGEALMTCGTSLWFCPWFHEHRFGREEKKKTLHKTLSYQ